MAHTPTLLAVVVVLLVGGINAAPEKGKSAPKDLGEIQPPGGVPLMSGRPGTPIEVEPLKKVTKRLEAVPEKDLGEWVAELERILGKKLAGEINDASEKQACRTYFVTRMSVAFDDLKWNPEAADKLFKRAQTLPPVEAKAWKEAFEAVFKKEIKQEGYAVPLVLIPVNALHDGEKYIAERGKKYLARLKQLTADDIALWVDKVDAFGGTKLDAAVNIILLSDYFDNEQFQRNKFKAAIEARKK
jgi:hypothetical protein